MPLFCSPYTHLYYIINYTLSIDSLHSTAYTSSDPIKYSLMLNLQLIITLFSALIAAATLLDSREDQEQELPAYMNSGRPCGWLYTVKVTQRMDNTSWLFYTPPSDTLIANNTCFPIQEAALGDFYIDTDNCQCCFYR